MTSLDLLRNSISRKRGRAFGGVIFLVLVFGLALGVIYHVLGRIKLDKVCEANLTKIYRALDLYEADRGKLPPLAFYPDEPMDDAASLRVALASYGVEADACICPCHPRILKETGLTYIWNATLSDKPIPRSGEPVWMVVDMTALSGEVPSPHYGGYRALFSDGVVRTVRDPLRSLRGL